MKNIIKWNNNIYTLYIFDNKSRFQRTKNNKTHLLSHDIWNFYNPNNRIEPKDGFDIHHIDGNPLNNVISNLRKILHSKHLSLHKIGNQNTLGKHWVWPKEAIRRKENHPNWKGGKVNKKYYQNNILSEKHLYSISDKENHFRYIDKIIVNRNTGKFTITHSWSYY